MANKQSEHKTSHFCAGASSRVWKLFLPTQTSAARLVKNGAVRITTRKACVPGRYKMAGASSWPMTNNSGKPHSMRAKASNENDLAGVPGSGHDFINDGG